MKLQVHVNLFKGSYDPRPTAIWTLEHALTAIREGLWQHQIEQLRHTLAISGKGIYDYYKKSLDAFTFCGTFAPTRVKERLTHHSGLAHTGQLVEDALDIFRKDILATNNDDIFQPADHEQVVAGTEPVVTRRVPSVLQRVCLESLHAPIPSE